MKKLLLVSILAAITSVSLADDATLKFDGDKGSVTLYGVLDSAVGYVKESYNVSSSFPASVSPFAATKTTVDNSVTGVFNGGIQDSRWGISGSEKLGNGLKAVFTLESGFNLPTGELNNGAKSLAQNAGVGAGSSVSVNTSLNGQLFNRQAWVGLASDNLGTVKLGRVYLPEYDVVIANDPLYGSQLFSPVGFSGTIGGGGGVSDVMRSDNSVRYSNSKGMFSFGGLYKFGNTAGSTNVGSAYALNGGVKVGSLAVDVAYQSGKDSIKASSGATLGTLAGTAYDTESYMVAGRFAVSKDLNVKAGYETYTLSKASDNMSSVTSYEGYPTLTTSYTGADQKVNVMWVGGDVNLSKKVNLAVGFYEQNPKAYGTVKEGKIYTSSALADYRFNNYVDTYVGLAYSQYKGDLYATGYNSSNSVVATGLRVKF
jgi:general bacterial porin, GBP family